MAEAYPLSWPAGWPRTPAAQLRDGRATFGKFKPQAGQSWKSKEPLTFAQARNSLYAALAKIGATNVVVSSNFQLNALKQPRGDRRRPSDEAVAVYFRRNGRDLVMARDAYWRGEENMRSLALALEAMATLERHGGHLMTDRAFTGFAALPPPPSCWEILELDPTTATSAAVDQAFRAKSRRVHPDTPTGDEEAFKRLTQARADGLRRLAERTP